MGAILVSPTHDFESEVFQCVHIDWFSQAVCQLFSGVNGADGHLLGFHMGPEVVQLCIQVLGSGAVLVDFGHFKCSAVVLKTLQCVAAWVLTLTPIFPIVIGIASRRAQDSPVHSDSVELRAVSV